MINCHVHLFTMDDVPPEWPIKQVKLLKTNKLFRWFFCNIFWRLIPCRRDELKRLAALPQHAAEYSNQQENFKALKNYYKGDGKLKYIVLPMDLRALSMDPPPTKSIESQHQELANLAQTYPDEITPFVHIDPRSET